MRAPRVMSKRLRTLRLVLCVAALTATFGELPLEAQRVRSRAARPATARPAAPAGRRATPARRAAGAVKAARSRVARGVRTARSAGSRLVATATGRPRLTVLGRFYERPHVRPAFGRALARTLPNQRYGGGSFTSLARRIGANYFSRALARAQANQRYGGYYTGFARRIGANYFSLSNQRWSSMSSVQRWRANRQFLDAAVGRGDRIRLASRMRFPSRGTYPREISYLMSRGYRIDPRGRWMLPPPVVRPSPQTSIRRAFNGR